MNQLAPVRLVRACRSRARSRAVGRKLQPGLATMVSCSIRNFIPGNSCVITVRQTQVIEGDFIDREPTTGRTILRCHVGNSCAIGQSELGQTIEIGDFPVRSLVPGALQDCSIDEFLEKLPEYDDEIDVLFRNAATEKKQLRYIASLDAEGNASVGLDAVGEDHPFCNINLTDNIVQFETERYSANPLVVQGPGAGPEVTAAGVFSDLLRLASYLSTGMGYV